MRRSRSPEDPNRPTVKEQWLARLLAADSCNTDAEGAAPSLWSESMV